MSPDPAPSIHYRRRWHYVLWVFLLLSAGAAFAWWETPARTGQARFSLALKVNGVPAGTRAALWTGRTRDWPPRPSTAWVTEEKGAFALQPAEIPLALRRFRQGYLLRRTSDAAAVVLEVPSGERRYLTYDLREDLDQGLLLPGRRLRVDLAVAWATLPAEPQLVPEAQRRYVGH